MEEKLSQRIRSIVDLAGKADITADIGCDHGLVSQALIMEKHADKVIACDISKKSLQKAINLARENHWSDRLDARCGDGLSVLETGEAQVIILAGMGGLLIRRILENNLEVAFAADRLICVPHGNEYELRAFLYQNGFSITEERLVKEDDHYYQMMAACRGKERMPDEFTLLFGKKLLEKKAPVLLDYLSFKRTELDHIIENAKLGKNTKGYTERLKRLRDRITEVLICP
ncbi:SAM-dependent methyltransferase [Christensenellaceae bacterium]|nr:SAM-dependent methyltransferase [Christensenellaceae bacterium]BDF60944.1 SAM-dependent methyltransferase [Christensenellaceae bacterium]